MNAPRCLIAEDEPLLAESLRAELATLWPELQVVAVVGDGASAVQQALALRPDVCFLDIRMPGLSGLEAAQALAEDWPDRSDDPGAAPFPLLVFATAYDQYAVQAFEAQAVDYLLKPVDRTRLAACVARLQARLQSQTHTQTPTTPARSTQPAVDNDLLQQTMGQLRALLGTQVGTPSGAALGAPSHTGARLEVIQAQVGSLVHMVPVAEVIYLEAADKYVRVVTADKEHLVRASLRELLPQLDPAQFWQVHRGTVVQAKQVVTAKREESGKVTLSLRGRQEKITVSRLYAHLFKGM
jgi:DNA-binding LytR/AlgR family response regulator